MMRTLYFLHMMTKSWKNRKCALMSSSASCRQKPLFLGPFYNQAVFQLRTITQLGTENLKFYGF